MDRHAHDERRQRDLAPAICRDAVLALGRRDPVNVAERAITQFGNITGAQAGVILVDAFGRIGFAHNAEAMEIGMFDAAAGVRHLMVEPIGRIPITDPYDPR